MIPCEDVRVLRRLLWGGMCFLFCFPPMASAIAAATGAGSPVRGESASAGAGAVQTRPSKAVEQEVSASAIAVRGTPASVRSFKLRDAKRVETRYQGQGSSAAWRALSLASADFDEDGVPDLASGYAAPDGSGIVTVHRGNVGALWPYGEAIRKGEPPAFFPEARVLTLPEQPDFLATGDFDADGHWDIVAARRGGRALYLVAGDGHGGFKPAQRIALPGAVTTLVTGEIDRADGLTDIVVGCTVAAGAKVLVFESPNGALRGAPEIFPIPATVTALALGRFNGGPFNDLAIAAGKYLWLVQGRDRKLSFSPRAGEEAKSAQVTGQTLPFNVRALAAGRFSADGATLAALDDTGVVHLLATTTAAARAQAEGSKSPGVAAVRLDGKPAAMTPMAIGSSPRATAAQLKAMKAALASSAVPEWTVRSEAALPVASLQAMPAVSRELIAARLSGSLDDDLMVVDPANSKLHILSTQRSHGPIPGLPTAADKQETPQGLAVVASLEVLDGAPAAVLPMRLSPYPLQSLVTLTTSRPEPMAIAQQATQTFVVTSTADSGPGTLRQVINDANSARGITSIVFNIPTTDPGYNAATGAFLIQPLLQGGPGPYSWALPPMTATMALDGYTQPGASPNALANGDNAVIKIEINGALATPQAEGPTFYLDGAGVIRGISVTGWTAAYSPDNTCGTMSGACYGAIGIADVGVGNYIEGNFAGVKPDGLTADGNGEGIYVDSLTSNNIVGGTTPQARNLISGNTTWEYGNSDGVVVLAQAFNATVEGNYIGTDLTGTKPLSNYDGVLTNNGMVIGGTMPGAGNVISGNTNAQIDFNDLGGAGLAKGTLIQGNFLGTDVTGTEALNEGTGLAMAYAASDNTVGGTTPAARNVISGNAGVGIDMFGIETGDLIQGNYLGVDAAGSKAVPNYRGMYIGSPDSGNAPAAGNTVGGTAAGAGNAISGNSHDGLYIAGTYSISGASQGTTIQGNLIGVDSSGQNAVGNGGNGIYFGAEATASIVGGTLPGAANVIANNTLNGVLIDPGSSVYGGDNTIGNTIYSNGGAGVRVATGTNNTISRNSIYNNGGLGIAIGPTSNQLTNSHCQASTSGANNLQNAPVLAAGTGSTYITATATDPNGNTSDFSNAVLADASNPYSVLGTFDSLPSTTYTIELFSSSAADPSGYGQGQNYLGSTTITTDSSCSGAISEPITPAGADLAVALSPGTLYAELGGNYSSDIGTTTLNSTVTNLGSIAAHNVVFTDTLPENISPPLGACHVPVTSSQGSCSTNGNDITCNLGTLPAGDIATIGIPIVPVVAETLSNTANVTATETDPNLANNTATNTVNGIYSYPIIDHFDPSVALLGSSDLPVTVYGIGFYFGTTVTVNGTQVPAVFLANQNCAKENAAPSFCSGLQIVVPAAQLTTAGKVTIGVTNPAPNGGSDTSNLSVAPCSYSASLPIGPQNYGTTGTSIEALVYTNIASCPWTATSSVPWASILYNSTGTGHEDVQISVEPNTGSASRTGNLTIAGQTVAITQAGGATCDYSLDQTSASIPSTGGTGSFNVTETGTGCLWTPITFSPWITITSSNSIGSFTSGAVTFSVAASPTGPSRTGKIMAGARVFTIQQDAGSTCQFTLSSSQATVPVPASTGSFQIAASDQSCPWTAQSNDSFVTISSEASGTGNGTVQYSVAANDSAARTGTIGAGNQTFTVQQVSANTCTYIVTATPTQISSQGGTGRIDVTPSFLMCKWTPVSSDPTALYLALNGPQTNYQYFYYTAAPNSGAARTLTVSVGCQSITLTQEAAPSSNPVPSISNLQPSSVQSGAAAFTLTVTGSNFANGAVVEINGLARNTTLVSATEVTASILASDVASAGTPAITVVNPTPGGGASNALPLTVTSGLLTQTINFTQPASPVTYAQGLTITLTATGGDSGNPVVFSIDSTSTGTGSITNSTLTVTGAGTFVIDANQAGNTNYSAAPQVQRTVVVPQAAQTISFTQPASPVTYSSGLTIALTAPGGASGNPVVFTIDPASTGTGSIAGSTLSVTGAGTFVIDANQAGNTNYSAAPQAQRTVVVNAVLTDFTMSIAPSQLTIAQGGSGTFTVTAAAANGPFNSAVGLSVSGLPTGYSSSFSAASITPGASSSTSTLTIQAANTAAAARGSYWPLATPALAVLILLPLRRRRRLRAGRLVLLAAGGTLLFAFVALSSCGGGFGLRQPVTSTITVTGTAGTDIHTATAQLTIE